MGNTIKSLTRPSAITDLLNRLGTSQSFFNEPAHAKEISEVVHRYLEKDPTLGDVQLTTDPGSPGYYSPAEDRINIGVVNPAVVGHELGHARNIKGSPTYRSLINLTNTLARLNGLVALPAMLSIRALVGDESQRRGALNVLSGISAALAAPGLAEEIGASAEAVQNAPDKLQAVKSLLPAFGAHLIAALTPMGIYQTGKFV